MSGIKETPASVKEFVLHISDIDAPPIYVTGGPRATEQWAMKWRVPNRGTKAVRLIYHCAWPASVLRRPHILIKTQSYHFSASLFWREFLKRGAGGAGAFCMGHCVGMNRTCAMGGMCDFGDWVLIVEFLLWSWYGASLVSMCFFT